MQTLLNKKEEITNNNQNKNTIVEVVVSSHEKNSGEHHHQKPTPPRPKPEKISRPFNFISVHNVIFDKCGRLWFIDVGTLETADNSIFYKNPILWAFETKVSSKGKLLSRPYLRYELEDSTPTGLNSLIVDIHQTCDDYHVYIPNAADNKIVVFSSEAGKHWQFESPTMKPVMKETQFEINNEEYHFTAGVYSLTFTMRDEQGFRDVYFTPASGTGQWKVNTHLLRDEEAAPNRFNPRLIKFVGYRGEQGLTRAQVYDPRTDVLFSSSVGNSVNCWNSKKILTPDTFGTAYSHMEMVFGADMKVS